MRGSLGQGRALRGLDSLRDQRAGCVPARHRAGEVAGGRHQGLPHVCPPSSLARLIQHTKDLMESEEKLCVKVLRTLQQMLLKKAKYGDRVSGQAGWTPCRPGRKCQGLRARTVRPGVKW